MQVMWVQSVTEAALSDWNTELMCQGGSQRKHVPPQERLLWTLELPAQRFGPSCGWLGATEGCGTVVSLWETTVWRRWPQQWCLRWVRMRKARGRRLQELVNGGPEAILTVVSFFFQTPRNTSWSHSPGSWSFTTFVIFWLSTLFPQLD